MELSQNGQTGPAEVALRESDLQDKIEAIDRRKLRIVLSYLSVMAILAVALIEGSFGLPAATLGILILVPLKKAIVRYGTLASEKAALLEDLRSLPRLEK